MDLPPVNICYIGAVGFYWNLVQPNTITFTTSLYEINRLIEEKKSELSGQESEPIDKELVEQKLPRQHQKFKDVFSKAVSDMLLPHQPYDYKIEIEPDKEDTLGYSPLY